MMMRVLCIFAVATKWQTAQGQTISCLQAPTAKPGETCTITLRGSVEPLIVALEFGGRPVRGAHVTFTAARGAVTRRTVQSDTLGFAETVWRGGADPGSPPDTVRIEVSQGEWYAARTMVLKPPAKTIDLALAQPGDSMNAGDNQSWYLSRQTRKPIRVGVLGPSTEAECRSSIVAFKASGDGVPFPDSTRGAWLGNRCVAEARWKLASTVGEQYLRAIAGSDPAKQQTVFRAQARNVPWVAAGLAFTYVSRYDRLASTSQDLQIVTKSGAAETTFKITKTTNTADSSRAGAVFTPTLGINTPVFTSWRGVRVSVSADVQHVSTDWFAGFSIPQLLNNVFAEDMGVDLQVVAHLSRREILTNPVQCAVTPSSCDTKKRTRPVGGGLVVQINGGAVLSTIMSLFPK
jgi:hypothetical protein